MKDGIARITVTGSGALSGEEAITHSATGKVYTKKESRYLLYEIADENESGTNVKYLLKLTGNVLEMTKTIGNQKTKIRFDPETRTESEYNSPFGNLFLSFITKAFFISEDDENLLFELEYHICMGEDILSENRLIIKATA
ncbi:MAG: DUF1934 domain-containing protein [Lachnospiraceae bacterium]